MTSMDHIPHAAWRRYRFQANIADPRPVKFPPPGPWWCTGTSDTYSIVVAYLPPNESLTDWWPEAAQIESTEHDEIQFSSRFPRPDWYVEVTAK